MCNMSLQTRNITLSYLSNNIPLGTIFLNKLCVGVSVSHPNILICVWQIDIYKIFGWSKSSEKVSLDCMSIQLVLILSET